MHARLAVAALATVACAHGRPATPRPSPPAPVVAPAPTAFHATIRWTAHGVPHIVAADVGGLGFGQGYAQAKAHLCELADGFVRVRGERARFLGRGPGDAHVTSDLAHLHLGYLSRARAMLPTASAETRAMLAGFAAGYTLALARTPVAEQPVACRGAAWLVPITAVDVAAYGLSLQGLASSRFLAPAIAAAVPGTSGVALAPTRAGASNAWAIGGDRTASGGGILVGNPHFPWHGDLLFHEAHLTIPGELDVYGGALVGTPGIQIGSTPHHAWTHTFSASTHQIVYRLELASTSALRYRHGDDVAPITPSRYAIAVRGADGAITTESFTRYASAVGPMIATPEAPWDGPGGHAFTVRDVALGGELALDQYLAMARADSREAFEAALAMHGTPFVNTVYVDGAGDALYVDGSRVPDLDDEALARWRLTRKLVPAVEAAWRQRLVILDGSDPVNDLIADDRRAPGAIPIARAPRHLRRDYVMNANDSHRFTNPTAPALTPPPSLLWGDDDGRPSPRTLANLAALVPGSGAAGADDRFTLDEATAAMLGTASFTAARLREDVAAVCPPPPPPRGAKPKRPAPPPDPIARPCAVLAAWDGRFDVDRRGALLWRALLAELAPDGAVPWARGFDPQALRLTPQGLARTPTELRAALVAAVARLSARGLAIDAPLGDAQRAAGPRGPVAVPGGTDLDGVTAIATHGSLDATALPPPALAADTPVDFGTSFVLAAEYAGGTRTVRALLAYGQSSDPASPWYRDQLDLLARGTLRTVPLTDDAIASDPDYRLEELDSP
jgi:acyl-homoserine-lactone acylase